MRLISTPIVRISPMSIDWRSPVVPAIYAAQQSLVAGTLWQNYCAFEVWTGSQFYWLAQDQVLELTTAQHQALQNQTSANYWATLWQLQQGLQPLSELQALVGDSQLIEAAASFTLLAQPHPVQITPLLIGLSAQRLGRSSSECANTPYRAYAISYQAAHYYYAGGVWLTISAADYEQVINNPTLYYFSTALKLHSRWQQLAGVKRAVLKEMRNFLKQSNRKKQNNLKVVKL